MFRVWAMKNPDLTYARIARDFNDMKKVMQIIVGHNSFSAILKDLWHIFNGITDNRNKLTAEKLTTV